MFIERIIYRELSAGIDRMIAEPALYEKFILNGLVYNGMSREKLIEAKDEASRAKSVFEERPPTVIHGYARVDGVFPCYAITLGSELTDQEYLGEDAMGSYLEDPTDEKSRLLYLDSDGNRIDPHIVRWTHNYDVYTYVDHPDLCLYYYYLARQILAEAHGAFLRDDLDNVDFNGAELAPDQRYLPSGMFVRRLGIKLASDQCFVEPREEGERFGASIAGTHVAEDANDATGVESNITPYQE